MQVKSANDWEHADLGDEARKGKFLKLMGAAKVSKIWHSILAAILWTNLEYFMDIYIDLV